MIRTWGCPGESAQSRRAGRNEAEQVQRYLLGDVGRYQPGGDAGLRTRVRQPVPGKGRAAGRAVTGRRTEAGVPEQVIPVRMRGKPCRNGLAQLEKVVGEGGHFVPCTLGSMSSTPAGPWATTALLWQNSLWWISTPSATCLSTGGSFCL